LNTVDEAGQLQIRWDPNSAPVRSASAASLEILDGDPPASVIPLDTEHLASGVFTYSRRKSRVDVTLVLDQPGGNKAQEATSFLGQKPPAAANPAQSSVTPPNVAPPGKDREELSRLVASLGVQLNAEIERNRKLEKQLAAVRAQLREQQLRRMGNQARPLER